MMGKINILWTLLSVFLLNIITPSSFAQKPELAPSDCNPCTNLIEFTIDLSTTPEKLDSSDKMVVLAFDGFSGSEEFSGALSAARDRIKQYNVAADAKLNIVLANGLKDGALTNSAVRVETSSSPSDLENQSEVKRALDAEGITSLGHFTSETAQSYLQSELENSVNIKNSVFTQIEFNHQPNAQPVENEKPKSPFAAVKRMYLSEYSVVNLSMAVFIGISRASVTTATIVLTNNIPIYVALPAGIFMGLYSAHMQYFSVPFFKWIKSPGLFKLSAPVEPTMFKGRVESFTTFHGKRFIDSFVFLSALKISFAVTSATMTSSLLGVFKDIAYLSFQGLFIGAPWAAVMNKLVQKDPGIGNRKGAQRYFNTTSINLTLAVIWQVVITMQAAGLNVGDYAAYGMFAIGTTTLLFHTKASKEIYIKMKDTVAQWILSPICSRIQPRPIP